MATDIPLQSESEFTSDMVKAVETIAVNVKLGSAEFSSSIDSLSKAIDGLKSSLIDSINSLKASASNVAPSSPSAAPRASQGRSPSAQDPAIAKQKEDDKRAKAEIKALNLKTAQERAIFNAKKLQLQIENANESKTTRRKKTDADTQQQSIEDVFKNVGVGFGQVFAVTKEQMAGMRTSGKKGKKEKPFEMDMGSLATASKPEGPGVDLPKSFIIGASDASDVWKNVFSEITVQTEKYRANQADISSLMDDIRSMLGDATDQAQVFSSEIEAALDSRTYLEQAQDAIDDLNPDLPELNEFEKLFNDLGDMFNNIEIDPGFNESVVDLSNANSLAESSVKALIDSVLNLTNAAGLESDIAEGILEGSENAANLIGDTFRNILNKKAGTSSGKFGPVSNPFVDQLSKEATDLSISFGLLMEGIHSGDANIAGFSDVLNFATSSMARLIEAMDQVKDQSVAENFIGPTQLTGPTQEGEEDYAAKKQKEDRKNQLQAEDASIKKGVDSFSVLFEAMFGKMGKSVQNVLATTMSGINRSFSDNSPVFDSIKSLVGNIASITPRQAASGVAGGARSAMGFAGSAFRGIRSIFGNSGTQENNRIETDEGFPGGINGDEFDTPRPQTLSSGGTVGYFAKGTKKKSFLGTLFNTIDDVFGGFFGKKKKKKKDDDESIFKPKGTDTVPAMLTPGEEVVKKSAAEKPENKAAIDAMNKSSGGKVGYFAGGTPSGGGKGIVGGLASLALGPVGQAFSVLTGSVKAASDAIGMFGSFVAKNNPAVMEQVNLAMNDLQGVIGRALVPVVQRLIPVLRFLGDGMDFVMKMLMPAITPIANAFATLAIPLIELEAVIAQFLAPAFEIVGVAVEGFAIMLDPVIQLLSEIVESFTQLIQSFLDGIPITKIMKDGFEILGQVVKMLVGAIVSVLGLFMSGMGVILQLTGFLVQGFGTLIKGIGDLISYIPGTGDLGAILSEAGTAVAAGGDSIKASGADLQKKGEEQRDRGLAKMGEGAQNIVGKFGDPNYKMKDNTRYKTGDVTGVGIKKGSSVGAAVRETQSTSISGVGDEVRKQALMAATGAKTQEESLKDISDKLSKDSLRDAFKEGMIAANGADKGNAGIQGKDPFSRAGHSKPNLAPV